MSTPPTHPDDAAVDIIASMASLQHASAHDSQITLEGLVRLCGAVTYTLMAPPAPLGPPGPATPRSQAIREALTHDAWVKTVGRDDSAKRYVYQFLPTGTYEKTVESAITSPAERGRWELDNEEPEGPAYLVLDHDKPWKGTYWLGR